MYTVDDLLLCRSQVSRLRGKILRLTLYYHSNTDPMRKLRVASKGKFHEARQVTTPFGPSRSRGLRSTGACPVLAAWEEMQPDRTRPHC